MSKIERTRNWSTIVYEESTPFNWREILESTHIPAYISPCHDKDVDTETGEIKKPHFHILLTFDSVKTREQAQEVFKSIGGVGAERVHSMSGMARYLCHLDNPDKAQYEKNEVKTLSGAEPYDSLIANSVDRLTAISEMIDYCNEQMVTSYSDLLMYAKVYRYNDWFRTLCTSATLTIITFLKSRNWERKKDNN